MIHAILSGNDGGIMGAATDLGRCGGHLGTLGCIRFYEIYQGYFVEFGIDLEAGVSLDDVAVYVYEDGSLIDTVQGENWVYPMDRNRTQVELVFKLGPIGWADYLQPGDPQTQVTLRLNHDDTATQFTVIRRSHSSATEYYVDRIDAMQFEINPASSYAGGNLTVSGTPGSELNAAGYVIISMPTATTFTAQYVLDGIDIASMDATAISTEPTLTLGGLWIAFEDGLTYAPGDSWRVDIGLPRTWTSPRLGRQESGLNGNAVMFRVDATNESGITTAGVMSDEFLLEAVDPAPVFASQSYMSPYVLGVIIEIGDLYAKHRNGQTATGGKAVEVRAYKNRIFAGESDAHYWPVVYDAGNYDPGDMVGLAIPVEEGTNNIEIRTLNSDGHLSDPLQIRAIVLNDALVAPANALTRIYARHTGSNQVELKTRVDASVSTVSWFISDTLPFGAATLTTAVTPTSAWEEVAEYRTLPDGVYYVGAGSNGEPDIYTVCRVVTMQAGGVVVDII